MSSKILCSIFLISAFIINQGCKLKSTEVGQAESQLNQDINQSTFKGHITEIKDNAGDYYLIATTNGKKFYLPKNSKEAQNTYLTSGQFKANDKWLFESPEEMKVTVEHYKNSAQQWISSYMEAISEGRPQNELDRIYQRAYLDINHLFELVENNDTNKARKAELIRILQENATKQVALSNAEYRNTIIKQTGKLIAGAATAVIVAPTLAAGAVGKVITVVIWGSPVFLSGCIDCLYKPKNCM